MILIIMNSSLMASLKKLNFVASPKSQTAIILINTTHDLPHTAAIETNPRFTRPTFLTTPTTIVPNLPFSSSTFH